MARDNYFDRARYPWLKRVAHSETYGRMELVEVNETRDGLLIGVAKIGTGRASYIHGVFLGRVPYVP